MRCNYRANRLRSEDLNKNVRTRAVGAGETLLRWEVRHLATRQLLAEMARAHQPLRGIVA